jgi:hypothetical protein
VEGSTGGASNTGVYGTPTECDAVPSGGSSSAISGVANVLYGTEENGEGAYAANPTSNGQKHNVASAGGAPQYDLATGGDHNRNQYDLATGGTHNRSNTAVTYAIPMEGGNGSVHGASSSVRVTAVASNSTARFGAGPTLRRKYVNVIEGNEDSNA